MKSLTISERLAAGKALRTKVARSDHGAWEPGVDRRDPVEILEASNEGRLPELVPIRYGRMLRDLFAFVRGSAALAAYDLASTPSTGVQLQACGDCHLSNFGLFATPERNLIFDINDFDETHWAPWEWDLKRLATSFVVAGRTNGFSDRRAKDAAIACLRSYRDQLGELATMSPLEIWYSRITAEDLIARGSDAKAREKRRRMAEKARTRVGENLFPRITEEIDGRHHFVEQPPLIERVTDESREELMREGFEQYRASLPEDRRFVFDRYRVEDFARRVVGIGSVGTRCYVGLFFCDDRNSLLLQVKEARRSVLEPYAAPCPFENQGQRVVVGQRLMQSASDMFLGWLRSTGHDYYVRQLRDMKYSVPVERLSAIELERYADVCGLTLARSHAKSGDAATIRGYLGKGDAFDVAVGKFAMAYADQMQHDYEALLAAVRSGRIQSVDDDRS
jgi:uncharacterized protein (DUF2252 family)